MNGECFALDYQLERRSQCSYPDGEGVCPDTALSGDPATDQVELVSCEKVCAEEAGLAVWALQHNCQAPDGTVSAAAWHATLDLSHYP